MRLAFGLLALAAATAQNFPDLRPSPQQLAWQDLEIGVLIHFGPNTFMDREWGDGTADPKVFDPKQLDAGQWVRAAQAAGAKYLILVAKHHDGFCLWPSRHTTYSVKASPWRGGKGDLVREVEQAARKHGLGFGIYLSPWDRHEPSYKDNKAYDRYYRNQMRELITGYGELTEWWLDGAGSEGHVYDFDSYVDELRTYQPNTLIFADVGFLKYGDIRWVGNESGHAPETNWNVIDRRGYLRYRPAEADTPLRKDHWFWHPNAEQRLKSLDELMDTYHRTVGRGAQLVLGLAPDERGLIPEVDVKRLEEFGAEVRRRYAKPAGAVLSGTGHLAFPAPTPIDRAVASEWLEHGQRVAEYRIRVQTAGGEWTTVARGSTIGHKKIDLFPRIAATAVRFDVLRSFGDPQIREFAVYDGATAR